MYEGPKLPLICRHKKFSQSGPFVFMRFPDTKEQFRFQCTRYSWVPFYSTDGMMWSFEDLDCCERGVAEALPFPLFPMKEAICEFFDPVLFLWNDQNPPPTVRVECFILEQCIFNPETRSECSMFFHQTNYRILSKRLLFHYPLSIENHVKDPEYWFQSRSADDPPREGETAPQTSRNSPPGGQSAEQTPPEDQTCLSLGSSEREE